MQTRLAPTDIGANNTRKCAVSLPCVICEMAEELVCGTRQALEQQQNEVWVSLHFVVVKRAKRWLPELDRLEMWSGLG